MHIGEKDEFGQLVCSTCRTTLSVYHLDTNAIEEICEKCKTVGM